MKSKHKDKSEKTTVDEFLSFISTRAGYEWKTDEEGIVHILHLRLRY